MVATFDDTALVDDDDLVGHAYGRESMRNDDGDAVLHQRAEVREDFGFGGGVHRCGRLIQHEDVGLTTHERARSEEHTSELQSLMRISYAVFCLKTQNNKIVNT